MLAERLRQRREAMNWTQEALSRKCGVAASVLSNYEAGRRTPSLANAERLGAALGVSLDWLMGKDAGLPPPANTLEAKIAHLGKTDRRLVERMVDGLMQVDGRRLDFPASARHDACTVHAGP